LRELLNISQRRKDAKKKQLRGFAWPKSIQQAIPAHTALRLCVTFFSSQRRKEKTASRLCVA
jgi:hypothetical protein